MHAYQKAILSSGMQLHAMSLHTIWSISFPFGYYIDASRVLIFLLGCAQLNSSFMDKISMTSQVLSRKKHGSETCNVYLSDKYQYGDNISYRGKIKSASLML